jgi:hypothetical protein
MSKLKSIPFLLLIVALVVMIAWPSTALAGRIDPWVNDQDVQDDWLWRPENPRDPPLDPPPGDHTVQEDAIPDWDPLSGGGRPPREGSDDGESYGPAGPFDPFDLPGDRDLLTFVVEMSLDAGGPGTFGSIETAPGLPGTFFDDGIGAPEPPFLRVPGGTAIPSPGALLVLGLGALASGVSRRRR